MKKILLNLLMLMSLSLAGCNNTNSGSLKIGETLIVYVDNSTYQYRCREGNSYYQDGVWTHESPTWVTYEISKNKAKINYLIRENKEELRKTDYHYGNISYTITNNL